VFGLGPATRIYVALGATDMRKVDSDGDAMEDVIFRVSFGTAKPTVVRLSRCVASTARSRKSGRPRE
jgi:hypothetical protein